RTQLKLSIKALRSLALFSTWDMVYSRKLRLRNWLSLRHLYIRIPRRQLPRGARREPVMPEHKNRIGVLVMSYGTPESMEDIETYYTHIRRGHPPTPEQLEELTQRYEAIVGGVFPLRENTNRQVAGLQDKLDTMAPG